jgi:hypothetical protein
MSNKNKSKIRHKKYNPNKHARSETAVFDAINLSMPINTERQNRLAVGIRTSLEAFTNGVAEKAHFDTLASTVDLAMMLNSNIFNAPDDFVYGVKLARDAMIRCRERYIRTKKLGLDGEALTALKFAIDLHEEQLKHVTGAELLKLLKKRDDHIRSGNYYKGGVAA